MSAASHIAQLYRRHRQALASTWSPEQLERLEAHLQQQRGRFEDRDTHGRYCCQALERLLAGKLSTWQIQQLLDANWNTTTELRHAILAARRPAPSTPDRPRAALPSSDAMAAATETLWSQQRLTGGAAPSNEQVRALATRLEMSQHQEPAAATSTPDTSASSTNSSSKLELARQALKLAEAKVNQPRFSGRAQVVVTFNETGTQATVPSSDPEKEPYTVKLTVEGEPYSCTCYQNVELARLCKHMEAARNAWWVCDRAADLKLSARVELIPKRAPVRRHKPHHQGASQGARRQAA